MNYKTITMPKTANYLSEIMAELPTGIFNKKITATGATTLALENKQNIILLCPTKGLIDNKIKQYPNQRCNYEFLKIDEHVNTTDVIKYINRIKGKQPVKLIATYDALQKVLGISNIYKDYHLVIDEFHELLKLTGERELRAIKILNEFHNFKRFTFLSATPVKEKHLPAQLDSLDYYELLIENIEKIKVVGQQTDKPLSMIVDIIKNFKANNELVINGKTSKHLYIYINTVSNIASIIKASGLTQKDVNIFCGDYAVNELKLSKVDCEIGELLTETELIKHPEFESPINFITSKGFQGCDIYSNDGVAIYVTNCHIKSTLSGMGTLQQVSGRIRTKSNPFNNIIYHVYNTLKSALTYSQYLQEQQVIISNSLGIINDWKNMSKGSKESIKSDLENAYIFDYTYYHYYDSETDTMLLNDLRIVADQDNHEVENLIYREGIEVRTAYAEQGFDNCSNDYLKAESAFKNIIQHKTFKEYCNTYNESLTTFYMVEPLFGCPEITKKFIIKAFAEIGFKRIQELKYHQGSIKNQFNKVSKVDEYLILKEINKTFHVNGRYSKTDMKAMIQSIYKQLNIKKIAKATNINEFFEVKECKMPDRTNGLQLVSKLYSIKDLKVA